MGRDPDWPDARRTGPHVTAVDENPNHDGNVAALHLAARHDAADPPEAAADRRIRPVSRMA